MERLKSGCILANMGHSNQEIDLESFKDMRKEKIRKNVSHIFLPNGRRIVLIAEVSGWGWMLHLLTYLIMERSTKFIPVRVVSISGF